MDWIINNWSFLVFVVAAIVIGFLYYKKFMSLPTYEQIAKIKQWLLVIVIEAEKQFGSKTGKIKLSWCYKCFIEAFPSLANIVSFELFSSLVDEVLEEMRHLLESNEMIAKYVEGV